MQKPAKGFEFENYGFVDKVFSMYCWLINFSPYPWREIDWSLNTNICCWFPSSMIKCQVKCQAKIEMHNPPEEVIYADW